MAENPRERDVSTSGSGMSQGQPAGEIVESMEALTAPSIKAVRTTFAEMQRTVDAVRADCDAASETLDALGGALEMITQSTGLGHDWAGFGVAGLPMMGALSAVKGIAGQYVKQQTGLPLTTWTGLVT